MKLILTYSDTELRSIATQRSPYKIRKNDYLSREIENELIKLLKLEFELIQEIYAKLESLKYIYGFEIKKSFEYMDKLNMNHLDENNFSEFISNNYKYITMSDAKMLIKRFDIDNDGKVGFSDYLFLMQLGKNNYKLNNYKLSRLNYSLPNFDSRLDLERNSSSSLSNKRLNNDSDFKNKILDINYYKKDISNLDNNYNGYGNLSYRQGEDPDIDTFRFNNNGFNIHPGKRNSQLDNFNLSEDKNILKTSLISYIPGS